MSSRHSPWFLSSRHVVENAVHLSNTVAAMRKALYMKRDDQGNMPDQDHDEGMGGQDIGNREPGSQGGLSSGTDWTMGPGDTGTDTKTGADTTDSDQGDSADNDGGTSGDYVSPDQNR